MFSEDTCEMIDLLHQENVKYMIVGGFAAIHYGHVRFTGDVDFFYEPTEKNCRQLFTVFRKFWDENIPSINSYKDLMTRGQILQFGRPPNRLDFINEIEGVTFEDCWKNYISETMQCDGIEVKTRFIGLDDLIKNKKAAGRSKDLLDADYLERVKKRNV
jgi:hypothetical protein